VNDAKNELARISAVLEHTTEHHEEAKQSLATETDKFV
jgi:hypothetical protein